MSDAPDDLTALEADLRHLVPREPALDRDTLLYRAGRASAGPGWVWPLATLIATTAAIILGSCLLLRPAPVVREVIYLPAEVVQEEPPTPPAEEPILTRETLPAEERSPHRRLQEHLLRWGLDGLPEPPPRNPDPPFPPGESLP